MADYTEKLTDSKAMELIDQIGSVFKSLPHLPSGVVEILVKIAPWLALLGGILGLISGPIVGLLGGLGSLFTLSPFYLVSTLVNAVVMTVQAVLLLMAFNPLKNREMKGWVFMFWSEALNVIAIVLSVFLGHTSSIVGSIVGLAIGFYILFETRASYTAAGKVMNKVAEVTGSDK